MQVFAIRSILYGQEALSSPFDVERWDTRPPAAPTDLTGKIDTMGIVRLKWKVNSEKDLWGYRVFLPIIKQMSLVYVRQR
jgi:hypothetical protein